MNKHNSNCAGIALHLGKRKWLAYNEVLKVLR